VHGARRIWAGYDRRRGNPVVLGFTLGIIYLVLLLVFAVLSFRKGHWVLGLIGFIFPVLWIIGAILPSRYARR
jgi:cadmium resistance protein CadD (predicted permease)